MKEEKERETRLSRDSSSDPDDEAEPAAKDEHWQEVRSKKKQKKSKRKVKLNSSSSSNSSDSEQEISSKKGKKGNSLRKVKMEALARERLHEARSKTEAEKYGDVEKVNYRMFKAKIPVPSQC